jgi:glucose-1-phosphate thymidylyltransferase
MKCLILAGGFATRLYPLTYNRAKALLDYRGKPVINHIIEKIPSDVEILVSTNKKFETDFLNWQTTVRRHVEICIEEAVSEEQKKGAVGALDFWIKNRNINEDLLVIAADNYFEFELKEMISKFDGHHALIATHDVGDKDKACEIGKACQLGLVTLESDRIVRFDEKPPQPTSSIISTGIYILPPGVFPLISKCSREGKHDNMGGFISYLLETGEEARAFVFKELWMDIGDEIKRGNIKV